MQDSVKKIVLYVCTTVVIVLIALAAAHFRGAFSQEQADLRLLALCDAFVAVGMIFTCLGALILCYTWGAFDIFAFSFKKLFYGLGRKKLPHETTEKQTLDYAEYKETKKEKDAGQFLVAGGLVLIVGLILYLIYKSKY